MVSKSRRDFMRHAGAAVGSVAAISSMPPGIRKALAMPANNRTGTIRDVEHVVVLMQENRSFDHYFGTLSGVRGFNDPRAVTLPNGDPVWKQPADTDLGYLLPFHPQGAALGSEFLQGTPHDWNSTHEAWHNGRYDQWVPHKGEATMAYLTREDIPFHHRLADAFTICDGYHCSGMLSTDPNRYYLWTGWAGNDGKNGGPVIDNAEAGYDWMTFPERLENAGMSWKIYQDIGVGLDADGYWGWTSDAYIGNYGCNSLLYFNQYRNAAPGSPLYDKARTGSHVDAGGHYLDDLKHDVENNQLPQVAWIAAPEAFCEHPKFPPNYGAWYIDQVLDILTANPEVWSKTALFINYDENDGYFDHVVPPVAPMGDIPGRSTVDTACEGYGGDAYYQAGPYGLGPRVPMLVVSPWSKGGYVCSELFDHTSVIQFIERRFGADHAIHEPQITPWRRTVCGDLTSAFNFKTPNDDIPPLPDTAQYKPTDHEQSPDTYYLRPRGNAEMPVQEADQRHARPLPYVAHARLHVEPKQARAQLVLTNKGAAGMHFALHAINRDTPAAQYTVGAGQSIRDTLSLGPNGEYDWALHGANGFYRRFAGNGLQDTIAVTERYNRRAPSLELYLAGNGSAPARYVITDHYSGQTVAERRVGYADEIALDIPLRETHGWYDISITRADRPGGVTRLAGHVETGQASLSDPALARAVADS